MLLGLLWCGDSLPGPVQGYALNVFKILFPALYAILDQMVNQIIGKMKHIRKIKNGFHLGGRQGSANVGLCNKEELCGFLPVLKLSQLVGGIDRFGKGKTGIVILPRGRAFHGRLGRRSGNRHKGRNRSGKMPGILLARDSHIADMDSYQIFFVVVVQVQKLISFPILQGAHYVLFRVIKLVCNIGYAGGQAGIHHAEQIKIDFQLGIVGILHVFINKKVGYNSRIHSMILIDCQMCHMYVPPVPAFLLLRALSLSAAFCGGGDPQ